MALRAALVHLHSSEGPPDTAPSRILAHRPVDISILAPLVGLKAIEQVLMIIPPNLEIVSDECGSFRAEKADTAVPSLGRFSPEVGNRRFPA